MDADIVRVQNLDQNVMTVRQQVEYLLGCVRRRELEKQKEIDQSAEDSKQIQNDNYSEYTLKDCHSEPRIVEPGEPPKEKAAHILDVIDEEPSELDSIREHENEKIFPMDIIDVKNDRSTENRYENSSNDEATDSSECGSSCSCQDTTNYMSTSVSIVAEETIYSPQKKGLNHAVRRTKIDQSSWDFSRSDDGEDTLTSLLQTRLQELEAEIDAFRNENSYVSKLRNDYEKEYNLFCQERTALLKKIKEEHLSGVKELEEERRTLECEKRGFEKYVREVKNRPNKQEKEEIRLLKEEIKLLKEEMNKKESRWAAAQARIRTEVKMLKDRNSALQDELKELKKTPKKVSFAPLTKKSKSFSNVRVKTKTDVPKSAEKNANTSTSLCDSLLDLPSTSDSGICTDTFQSLSESCDGISESLRRSICLNSYLNADTEKEDSSDEISASELTSKNTKDDVEISELTDANGNREKLYADGRKEIWCANGSVKKISSDGKITKTIFYNGDVEEVSVEQNVVKYYHAASKTWHSNFGNGLEIKEFPNGQVEKYFEDGSVEIRSPDGTLFTSSSSGEKKWNLKDETIITMNEKTHEKRIVFANGQIETHTPEFKRRKYPDGTVKTVYNGSGMQETRYPNGRIRLKNQDGTLISDTKIT